MNFLSVQKRIQFIDILFHNSIWKYSNVHSQIIYLIIYAPAWIFYPISFIKSTLLKSTYAQRYESNFLPLSLGNWQVESAHSPNLIFGEVTAKVHSLVNIFIIIIPQTYRPRTTLVGSIRPEDVFSPKYARANGSFRFWFYSSGSNALIYRMVVWLSKLYDVLNARAHNT